MHMCKMQSESGELMEVWEKRRRNIHALMGVHRLNGTSLAAKAGLSVNTVNKFLNGSSKTMSEPSLAKIAEALDLASIALLDADNPFSNTKNELYRIIDDMSEAEARAVLEGLTAQEKVAK